MSEELRDKDLEGTGGAGNDTNPKGTDNEGGDAKFTQEDLNKAIEARLLRERKKFESQVDTRAEELLKTKLAEKQRISTMSEEEKAKEALTEKEKALLKKESELNYRERFTDTGEALSGLAIPTAFAKFIVSNDEETTYANLKEFQTIFEAAKADFNKEALKGARPKVTKTGSTGITKERFNAMTYAERVALKKKDEDLYNKLKK